MFPTFWRYQQVVN